MYIRPPNIIATNARKNFVSKDFVNNAKSMAIEIEEVPVKAHNLISKVKRYYATIRRAYKVILANLRRTIIQEHIL